jgi:hypothetical protein
LQQLRQLNEVEPLIKWTHTVEDQGYDFISYRLKDGTREAFNKAAALIAAGKVVFWDRWSLPRQLAEYNQRADDLLFRAYVAQTIQHANTVWGIMTPAYGEENSFSAYERLLAEKHGNFMEWPCPKTKSA